MDLVLAMNANTEPILSCSCFWSCSIFTTVLYSLMWVTVHFLQNQWIDCSFWWSDRNTYISSLIFSDLMWCQNLHPSHSSAFWVAVIVLLQHPHSASFSSSTPIPSLSPNAAPATALAVALLRLILGFCQSAFFVIIELFVLVSTFILSAPLSPSRLSIPVSASGLTLVIFRASRELSLSFTFFVCSFLLPLPILSFRMFYSSRRR